MEHEEKETTYFELTGSPHEKAQQYCDILNEQHANTPTRYSKRYQEMLPWVIEADWRYDIGGHDFLFITRGASRFSSKEEFIGVQDDNES